MEMTVAELRQRLEQLEDRLALYEAVASYGPAVDSGSSEIVAGLWTDDGRYDTFPRPLNGQSEIATMVRSDAHQSLIRGGCAHILGMPRVELDDDTAVATCYSQVLVHDEETDEFRVWRVSANRWEFRRTPDGWRATSRVNRLVDGNDEARQLLAAAGTSSGSR
jgi:hypothetical protein